ncbi:ion transporter [Peptococcaceae bacterium]|nr:ion transporter [Peptococcaceae bacterium]
MIEITRQKLKTIYELIMISLAILVAVLLFREFFVPISTAELYLHRYINLTVLLIFAADYFVRFFHAKNKKTFVKKNIPELIAIIPFETIFQLARLARLVRLVRLIRLFRAAVIFRRYSDTLFGILRTNSLQYIILATTAIALLGALGIQIFEKDTGTVNDFNDALWWSVVTITTVGYGDIAPVTTGGRILAAFLMIVGIGFLGMITGTIATYFVDKILKNKATLTLNDEVKQLILSQTERLETLDKQQLEHLVELIRFYNQSQLSQETTVSKSRQSKQE